MLSEMGSAYHVNVVGGATQLAMQQAWWQEYAYSASEIKRC